MSDDVVLKIPGGRCSKSNGTQSMVLGSFSRRAWIQGGALAVLVSGSQALAQESSVDSTLRSMSSITGSPLTDQWLTPVATLVSVILEDSKSLRALELGSIEPATYFRAG